MPNASASTRKHQKAPSHHATAQSVRCATCDMHLRALREYERRLAVAREALFVVREQTAAADGRTLCACRPFVVTVKQGPRQVHSSACYLNIANAALKKITA